MERNLKGRYRGSLLGVYWSLLNPLIMTGLYAAIFGTAFASYYSRYRCQGDHLGLALRDKAIMGMGITNHDLKAYCIQ